MVQTLSLSAGGTSGRMKYLCQGTEAGVVCPLVPHARVLKLG